MAIRKVGVLGCGLMGSGIAQVCAQAGLDTLVLEANSGLLEKGMGRIRSFLQGGVDRGKIGAQERDAILSRLRGTTDTSAMADRDLVILLPLVSANSSTRSPSRRVLFPDGRGEDRGPHGADPRGREERSPRSSTPG